MLIKQHRITHRAPSSKFEVNDLVKLIEVANSLHEDCRKQLKDDIFSGKFPVPGLDLSKKPEAEKLIDDNFKIIIEIFGDDGEYINVLSLDEIQSQA